MRTRLVLFIVIASFICSELKAQVNVNDSLALVDLYNSTGGKTSWIRKDNWLTPKPVSTWYGITVQENRVTSVRLDSNKLSGSIPVSFGNLAMLSVFSATQNSLSGKLPYAITQLSNLTYLNLFWNDFLFIKLTPAFSRLQKLAYLNLAVTDLEGEIPDEIGKLSRLVYLNLGNGKLIGAIPQSLGRLSQLSYLNLNSNDFTVGSGIPDSLANLTQLDTLDLGYNYLGGQIPLWLPRLTHLKALILNGSNLTGSIPAELSKLINLQFIDFDYNSLSGTLPSSLSTLTNLQEFYVYDNQLSGIIPPPIGKLKNLIGLDLSVNQFTGTIPVELSQLSQLQYLSLYYNKLTGNIPEELGNLTQLSFLDLSVCNLTGHIPTSLGNLVNIDYLNFANNKLDGTIPTSLGNLKRTEHLYLGNNHLRGEVPRAVLTLPRLYDVDLSNNELTQSINYYPPGTIIKIDELNLKDNQYTFNGLEYLVSTQRNWQYFDYSSQAQIPIHLFQDKLAVSAGGTLSNNTYKWFRVGSSTPFIVTGDSLFQPQNSGRYFAQITNALAKQLTLYTDTVNYSFTAILNTIAITPNPANSTVLLSGLNDKSNAVITIADMRGYVWIRIISHQQRNLRVDVGRLKTGNYMVNVSDGKEVKTAQLIKE